jgi:site-specific DNA recombinase
MYYVMYLRKSRADMDAESRGEGETLARHRTALRELASRNGHVLAREYAEVVSGETIASRPQMQRLLMDIADPECVGVYVMEVERLARGDTMDQGRVAQAFLYSNTKIITPAKTYDPANEFDQEYFEFGLFMSRREYKTINRRIQAGRIQSVKEGKFPSSFASYGYRKVKIKGGKGHTLEIVPEEAEVVRQIFNWYVYGIDGQEAGTGHIVNKLIELGISPGERAKGWQATRVYRMLHNEEYIGMIRWGYVSVERKLTADGIKAQRSVSHDYQLHKGLHKPIVDEALFYAAQRKLEGKSIPLRNGMAMSNPLVGLVYCKQCGHLMSGQTANGKTPAQILCRTHGCPTVANARPPVEAAILSVLRDWLDQYQAEQDPFHELEQNEDQERALLEKTIAQHEEQKAKLLKRKESLHDLLEEGVYDVPTFQDRLSTLQIRLHEVEETIQRVRDQLEATGPRYGTMEQLAPAITHVLDVYTSTPTAQEKNELLKSVISRIDYDKTVRGTTSPKSNPNSFVLDIYPKIF